MITESLNQSSLPPSPDRVIKDGLTSTSSQIQANQFAATISQNQPSQPEPRQPNLSDNVNAKYARLSDAVYQQIIPSEQIPEGYEQISTQGNTDTGLAGAAFYNNETNELVIAYRGTEMNTIEDLRADYKLARGKSNPQTQDALAYADAVVKQAQAEGLEVDQITFTGHSLGGGIATEVAGLRMLQGGEENQAIVFEAPGTQRSLESHLGQDLTTSQAQQLRSSQVNYRTDTPISGPNNPVSATRYHTAELVNLNMERIPSETPLQELQRHLPLPGPALKDFWDYTINEQHNIGRIADIMEQERGIGLDPEASAQEAQRFKAAFEERIVPSDNLFDKLENLQKRNEYISLRTIHGEDVNVRVDRHGNIRFERGGAGMFENVAPERFNIDLSTPYNQEQLQKAGLEVSFTPPPPSTAMSLLSQADQFV